MSHLKIIFIILTIFLFQTDTFAGEDVSASVLSKEHIVLTGEENLFHQEAFAFQTKDSASLNGKAVCFIKDKNAGLKSISWNVDYSRLKLGRKHTLYGVFKVKSVLKPNSKAKNKQRAKKNVKGGLFIETSVRTRDKKVFAGNETELSTSEDKQDVWQTAKLLDFILQRDTTVVVKFSKTAGIEDFLIDNLYLVSDYEPLDDIQRGAFKPLYPKEHYAHLFNDFSFVAIYRVKNPFSEDIRSVLERQLYDIRLHHIDTVLPGSMAGNPPAENAFEIIKTILEIADKLNMRVIVPLTAFFDEDLTNKFRATQLPDEVAMKRIKEVVNEYVPKFKNYESLLGYFLEDEPYPHQVQILTAIQREIEQADSVHPVISSLQSPHQVYTFGSTQNVIFSACFPYLRKRQDLLVLGTKIMAKEIKINIFNGYYWLCLQGFTRGDGERITRADYRLQANLEVMGGVDGLVNYVYTANRYITVPEGDENYFFTNVLEMPYQGEYDLWREVKELGGRFFPLKGILTKLSPAVAEGIDLESNAIYANFENRQVIDLEVKELNSGEKFIFICNIDNKNKQDGRLSFSKEILSQGISQKKVFNLFELKEENLNGNFSFEFSLPPGEMNIYVMASDLQFHQIKKDILFRKLKEGIEILKLEMKPFGVDHPQLSFLNEGIKEVEGALFPENLSNEVLLNYLERLSKLKLRALEIMEKDAAFSNFSNQFSQIEDSLYKIEDFIKANKMKTQRVSKKQAEKYGIEEGIQWKITSPKVDEVDNQFFPLAQRYLAIKTKLISAQWKAADVIKELDSLFKDINKVKIY